MLKLRKELMPPPLNDDLVNALITLAKEIDGATREDTVDAIKEFNTLAGTTYSWEYFQGINGSTDYKTWVKTVLSDFKTTRVSDITYDELIEICRRVTDLNTYKEWEINVYLDVLDKNLPNSEISDLIFWPDIWFNNDNFHVEMADEKIIDWAIAKDGRQIKGLPKSWKKPKIEDFIKIN